MKVLFTYGFMAPLSLSPENCFLGVREVADADLPTPSELELMLGYFVDIDGTGDRSRGRAMGRVVTIRNEATNPVLYVRHHFKHASWDAACDGLRGRGFKWIHETEAVRAHIEFFEGRETDTPQLWSMLV